MEWMRAALLKVQRSPFHEHGRNLGAWPLSAQKDEMWGPLWWCIAPPYRHVTIDDWQSVALVNALPLCGKHWPFIQVQRSLRILGLKGRRVQCQRNRSTKFEVSGQHFKVVTYEDKERMFYNISQDLRFFLAATWIRFQRDIDPVDRL